MSLISLVQLKTINAKQDVMYPKTNGKNIDINLSVYNNVINQRKPWMETMNKGWEKGNL